MTHTEGRTRGQDFEHISSDNVSNSNSRPPESSLEAIDRAGSSMGSKPTLSHAVTLRLLGSGRRLLGCEALPISASESASSLP